MKMKQLTVAMITLLLTASCSEKQQDYPFRNPDLPLEERIDDLLSRLTPEEKIGQMMNVTPAIERLGIPTYDWWNEALHGVARAGRATVFPQAIAMAATFDDNAVHETFTMVSDEARAKYHQYQKDKEYDRYKGLTFWTPNINIFRDPRWGRGMETYGEDPYLTEKMGADCKAMILIIIRHTLAPSITPYTAARNGTATNSTQKLPLVTCTRRIFRLSRH